MLNGSFLHSPKRKVFFIVLLIVVAAVIAIGARKRRADATKVPPPAPVLVPVPAVPAAAQGNGRSDHNMQVELVTVRRHGFEPAEITRPKGRFLLAIDNRSGLEEINLQIVREAGNREREMKVHRRKPDWRGLVDLPPGRYRLTEAGHPDWACRITITAR